jgi:hypothetical protein
MKRKKFAEGGDIGSDEIASARADMDRESDIKESARAVPKMPKRQTFGEAFKAARARPTGSGSTFMYEGKSYHFGTKEEEATRPGGRGPMGRSSTGPDSKKPASPTANKASTSYQQERTASRAKFEQERKTKANDNYGAHYAKVKAANAPTPYQQKTAASRAKFEQGRKTKANDNYGAHYAKVKAANAPTSYQQERAASRAKFEQERQAKIKTKGMNMGGMTNYKSGGSCGMAKGGGVETKGKTRGKFV